MSSGLNRDQIIEALDAEIARLQRARTLIARSAIEHPVRFPKMPPIASITPKKRTLSVVAGERIAKALGSSREKSMPVLITRVPARERPVRRIPKTLKTLDTSLTGNVPEGPVAVPARG